MIPSGLYVLNAIVALFIWGPLLLNPDQTRTEQILKSEIVAEINAAEKSQGLLSAADQNPYQCEALDALESIYKAHLGNEIVESVYGQKQLADGTLNMKRYEMLAQDARWLRSKNQPHFDSSKLEL